MKSIRQSGSVRALIIAASAFALLTQMAAPVEAKTTRQRVNTTNGKRIYNASCTECHATGKDDAPVLEFGFNKKNPTWKRRTFPAQEVLDQHKQKGYVQIPAPAGKPKLTDQDVIDATHYIMVMLRREPVR
jgi:cytochrome c5